MDFLDEMGLRGGGGLKVDTKSSRSQQFMVWVSDHIPEWTWTRKFASIDKMFVNGLNYCNHFFLKSETE